MVLLRAESLSKQTFLFCLQSVIEGKPVSAELYNEGRRTFNIIVEEASHYGFSQAEVIRAMFNCARWEKE
jgi:hypothetical protein